MQPVLIIFLLLLAPTAVILVPLWLRSRERTRLLATIAATAERGQVLSPELIERVLQPPTPRAPALPQHLRDHRRGVLLIATAVGFATIGLLVWAIVSMANLPKEGAMAGLGVTAAGAIPAMLGIAYLLLARNGARVVRA